jgi:hypothetical protein
VMIPRMILRRQDSQLVDARRPVSPDRDPSSTTTTGAAAGTPRLKVAAVGAAATVMVAVVEGAEMTVLRTTEFSTLGLSK